MPNRRVPSGRAKEGYGVSYSYSFFNPSGGAEDSFIYLLTGILFLFAVISFVRSRLDILHPAAIYNLCLSGCCALAAFALMTFARKGRGARLIPALLLRRLGREPGAEREEGRGRKVSSG